MTINVSVHSEYEYEQANGGRDSRTRLARRSSQAQTGKGKSSFSLFSRPRAGLATLSGWSLPLLHYMVIHPYFVPVHSITVDFSPTLFYCRSYYATTAMGEPDQMPWHVRLSLGTMFPPNVLTVFVPVWGMFRRLWGVQKLNRKPHRGLSIAMPIQQSH